MADPTALGVRPCRGGWKLDRGIDEPDEVHVRPRDDLMWHPLNRGCACGPAVAPVDDPAVSLRWLVVHHALDGRGTGERPPDV